MVIYEDKYHYGWDGDNGIGERLIQQIIDGKKTATCAPKISYTPDELERTCALVGKVCTVTDKLGTPRCNVRHLEVFETTFGNPDPRLVKGEGDGDDVEKFKWDHIKAWNGMATEGVPLTDETILVVELFELVVNSPLIKILAISGSLRNRSSNSLLMRSMVEMAPRNANVTIYDELGLLPHFNPDLDGNDVPLEVNRWRNHLREADGVFICTPEYAKGVPGTLKNALDWVVSSGEFYNKPVAIVSASPHPSGGEIAHASLLGTLSMMNAIVAEDCSLKVPLITMKLSPDGSIIDEQTKFEAQKLMDSLIRVSSK